MRKVHRSALKHTCLYINRRGPAITILSNRQIYVGRGEVAICGHTQTKITRIKL